MARTLECQVFTDSIRFQFGKICKGPPSLMFICNFRGYKNSWDKIGKLKFRIWASICGLLDDRKNSRRRRSSDIGFQLFRNDLSETFGLIECKNKDESTSRSSILKYVFEAINEKSPLTKLLEIAVNIYNKTEFKFQVKVKID